MKFNQRLVLAGFVGLCLAVGALGGWATSSSVADWYPTLNKPAWNPPAWVFGPVWTVLYVMMGVAAWLVWKQGKGSVKGSGPALGWFFVQLALNGLWSFLFFGARSPGLAFLEILLLWAALAMTIYAFFQRSKPAGLIMLPYIGWVSFAAFLNFSIWRLN